MLYVMYTGKFITLHDMTCYIRLPY